MQAALGPHCVSLGLELVSKFSPNQTLKYSHVINQLINQPGARIGRSKCSHSVVHRGHILIPSTAEYLICA